MARTGIQRGKTPKNKASATDGTGDMLKTPIGGSPEAELKGASRYNRR